MEKIRILCFGDSNTWGAIPGEDGRFPPSIRWTGLLQTKLGDRFSILEEGLCGRTVATKSASLDDDGEGLEYFYHGANYFYPCILSHDPLDLIVVMLGTNDLKDKFENSVEEISRDLERYYIELIEKKTNFLTNKPLFLIVSPVAMNEESDYVRAMFSNGNKKLAEIEKIYQSIADKHGAHFISAFDEKYLGDDGLHFGVNGHALFAEALTKKIQTILS